MIKDAIQQAVAGKDLSYQKTAAAINEIMTGQVSDIQIAAFLTALTAKGETIDEIAGAAAAMQEWSRRTTDTHYVIGSVMGPAPFPAMVADFQAIISQEIKKQLLAETGKLPDAVVACVGGGSNAAMGAFYHFIADPTVRLIGCEAAGKGVDTDQHAATIERGSTGIFHGMKSIFLQNNDGQIDEVYSISAGLDYPGIGPQHAALAAAKRAEYVGITDDEAVAAFEYVAREEGIIAAIESCHAVAYVRKLAPTMRPDQIIVCNLSGRGDKDVAAIARYRGKKIYD